MSVGQLLRLNLDRIRGSDERIDRRFEPSVFSRQNESLLIVAPVELGFDVHQDTEGGVRLSGEVSSTIELACSRCVEPFRVPVQTRFDLHYIPQAHNVGEGEREVEPDDLSTAFYDGDAINLEDLIYEQLYLALPMKPLCDEACKGLCATCGKNLNAGPCDCKPQWEDPRLAALKGLLKH